MDKQLPDDFDLAEHYGDAAYDERYDDEQEEDHEGKRKSPKHWPKCPARDGTPEVPKSAHEMPSMLRAIFEFFIPPVNQDPETQRRWKIAMGFAIVCLSTATLVAWGIFQPFGHQGFAYSADVKAIRAHQLNRDLLDAIIMQCTVIAPESTASAENRKFYAKWVQDLANQFLEAEGTYPRLPTCAEVR